MKGLEGWRDFLQIASGERKALGKIVLLSLVGIVLELLMPWPLKLLIDHVLVDRPLPDSIAAFLPQMPADLVSLVAAITVTMCVLALSAQALQVAQAALHARVSARLQHSLGAFVLERLQRLSLSYHAQREKGDLLKRVTADTSCLPVIVLGVIFPVLTALVMLGLLFAIMWRLDPLLTVVAAVVVIPMAALMRYLGPRMLDRAYEQERMEGKIWALTEQTLTAIPLIQAFGRERHELTRFQDTSEKTVHASLKAASVQIQFTFGVELSQAVGIAAVMLFGGMQVLSGATTVGVLIVFIAYIAVLYGPLTTLAFAAQTAGTAAGAARRVNEVLQAADLIQEKKNAGPLRSGAESGTLKMCGVTFGYRPGRPVLFDIDLEVHAGETVALVGPTGAGKTTLVSMVPRLFDPWEGNVSINGQDLRTVSLESVRSSVAYVPQDPFLLPVSVKENIAYGRPDATDRQILQAAILADAHEFIARLPQGYDTIIGERGATLSGGQRQRLAIARALLKDAPVLILDEPTSALDAWTEQRVVQALRTLKSNRTTVMIAHRLSTVAHADRVLVLDGGRVVQAGAHDALLAVPGFYRTICRQQLVA